MTLVNHARLPAFMLCSLDSAFAISMSETPASRAFVIAVDSSWGGQWPCNRRLGRRRARAPEALAERAVAHVLLPGSAEPRRAVQSHQARPEEAQAPSSWAMPRGTFNHTLPLLHARVGHSSQGVVREHALVLRSGGGRLLPSDVVMSKQVMTKCVCKLVIVN